MSRFFYIEFQKYLNYLTKYAKLNISIEEG